MHEKHIKFPKKMKYCLSSQIDNLNNSLLLVSGGVDSMGLLHFFIKNDLTFEVLHINHLTRGSENDLERDLIKKQCLNNKIKFHYYEFKYQGGNFQANARNFRYDIATEIVSKSNLKQMITAHHRDDLVETILMYQEKLMYRGIEKYNTINKQTIYRPLLDVYKSEIYAYAKDNNVEYNEDISNQKNTYKRNQIRNKILADFSVNDKEQIILKELKRVESIPKISENLTIDKLKQYSIEEQKLLLNYYLKANGVQSLSQKTIVDILQSLSADGTQLFTLSNNMQLIINYGIFKVCSRQKDEIVCWQKACLGINNFNGISFENKLDNCWITTRQSGDKIVINGMTKKLSRVMIEYKIPQNLRCKWPIVCDKNRNLLYIPKFSLNIV